MEQHPVPQQISSYQFRLVGDMTLKQFFQLAGGCLVGLIFYGLPLNPAIKWFIIIFSVLSGAALAFLPYQDRPLETWILAFFRSVYSPTLFYWKRGNAETQYFQPEKEEILVNEIKEDLPAQKKELNTLEETEKSFLGKVTGLLHSPSPQQVTDTMNATGATPQTLQTNTIPTLQIPQSQPVAITQKTGSPQPPLQFQDNKAPQETPLGETLASHVYEAQKPIEFTKENLYIPTQPNIITGQVLDSEGKIVENSILEIKDQMGRPVRALKTNKAGHFLIVTPLPNGKYELIIEKEGIVFDPLSFDTKGEIIQPIIIKAKAETLKVSPAIN